MGAGMIVAVFDPFSGASGDMILGALVSAGAPLDGLKAELGKLGLPIRLEAVDVDRNAVNGKRISVIAEDDAHSRSWGEIRDLIEASTLDVKVIEPALSIFRNLAEAEAKVHGSDVDSVHFHEVGG